MRSDSDWPVSLTNRNTGRRVDLPGVYKGMRINGQLLMDEASTEGKSGKRKQPQGYDDAEIELLLILLDEEGSTALAKLETLEAAYKERGANPKPPVYTVVSPHTAARNIDQVVWTKLESSEMTRSDLIRIRITLREHNPVAQLPEERTGNAPSTSQTDGSSSGSAPESESGADLTAPNPDKWIYDRW